MYVDPQLLAELHLDRDALASLVPLLEEPSTTIVNGHIAALTRNINFLESAR